MLERLYLIHNPLNGLTDWVSEREFKVGSQKLKDVFGVLYLDDVKFMLHYNVQFKEAIMKKYDIVDEGTVSLNHVCYMISSKELMELINKETAPSVPSNVELRDGYFSWNEENKCYVEAVMI